MIEHLKNSKTDIVVGVRKFDEINHFSKTKKFLQKLGSRVVRIVSGQKFQTLQVGLEHTIKMPLKGLGLTLTTVIHLKL